MEVKKVKLSALKLNDGNPRIIKDFKFHQLVKSLLTFPEMLRLREVVCDETMLILGGNMRCRALMHIAQMTEQELKQELKKIDRDEYTDQWLSWHDCPMIDVKIAEGLSDEQKKEFIVKDNVGYGEWDWDMLANEWDMEDLKDWGVDIPVDWGTSHTSSTSSEKSDDEIYEEKKREFEERMAAGENVEEDEEYQEFLKKFEAKKTTDDCYTPELIYDAVVEWVEKEYDVKRKDFVRPFYPGGDYQNFNYPKGSVVVDNPPFSILAEILQFYDKKGIKFFLFAPSLTLFSSSSSSSSTAICIGAGIIYANGAGVNTSFLTNLGDRSIRFRSAPDLYKALDVANTENLKQMRKELPKYTYPDHIVTSTFVGRMSKYGIDISVSVGESEPISALDHQKKEGKAIYGKGYIISEKAAAEKAAAEKAAAEKAAATRWQLSDKEWEIIKKLSQ
jgi:hypothetical protein